MWWEVTRLQWHHHFSHFRWRQEGLALQEHQAGDRVLILLGANSIFHLQLGWWVGCMGGSPTPNFQIVWCFLQVTKYKIARRSVFATKSSAFLVSLFVRLKNLKQVLWVLSVNPLDPPCTGKYFSYHSALCPSWIKPSYFRVFFSSFLFLKLACTRFSWAGIQWV